MKIQYTASFAKSKSTFEVGVTQQLLQLGNLSSGAAP